MNYTSYIIWCRPTTEANALWSAMDYAPRLRADAEALVEYYKGEWGNLYEYEVVLKGFYPQGMREPCFV